MGRKEKKLTEREAILALASCQNSRFLIVMEALQQCGYHFTDEAVAAARKEHSKIKRDGTIFNEEEEKRAAEKWTAEKRNAEGHRDWLETDDEIALALRSAYLCGVNFTALARKLQRSRPWLYKLMYGTQRCSAQRDKILLAVREETERARKEGTDGV